MASKKSPKTGGWYEVDSLSPKDLIDLGFDEEFKANLNEVSKEVKKKPCSKIKVEVSAHKEKYINKAHKEKFTKD